MQREVCNGDMDHNSDQMGGRALHFHYKTRQFDSIIDCSARPESISVETWPPSQSTIVVLCSRLQTAECKQSCETQHQPLSIAVAAAAICYKFWKRERGEISIGD